MSKSEMIAYIIKPTLKIILILLYAVTLTGCESVRYYTQAITGQIAISSKQQSINELLREPHIPIKLKDQLKLVMEIREFAKNELHLPIKNQYLSFAELERPYVLWNVYATPEFSFTPKTWCYPIVGCTAYRGYFSLHDANDYTNRLRKQGYDVFISGVAAYSTLGWFDDPVLSTFIYRNETRLAALIFHELAHQLLYVKNDTTFNESFATIVEQESLRRWFIAKNNLEAFKDYKIGYQRKQQFIKLIVKYRNQLELIYSKDLPTLDKRHAKSLVFYKLRDEYRNLKQKWKYYAGYDLWFSHKLNNAQLITVSIYYDLVPEFFKLLQNSGYDLEVFYRKCQDLAERSPNDRFVYPLEN